jgi:hypothetical protein
MRHIDKMMMWNGNCRYRPHFDYWKKGKGDGRRSREVKATGRGSLTVGIMDC